MSIAKVFKSRAWNIFWHFLFRCFIMLGLPLLGWGLDDVAGFFASPVRIGLAVVALGQALINAWLLYGTQLPPQPQGRFEPYHSFFDITEMIFFLAAFDARRDLLMWDSGWAVGWAGLAIYLLGCGLSVWSNSTWVTYMRRKGERAWIDPALLSEGAFRWIRYPGLLCLGLYGLGFSIIFQSWLGLILMIPWTSIAARRAKIRDEEMAEEYPKVWPERDSTSKRIIPFVY